MSDLKSVKNELKMILSSGKITEQELSKKIKINKTTLLIFLKEKILLPAEVVQKIYKYLEKEERENQKISSLVE